MPRDVNALVETLLVVTTFPVDASTDLTTNLVRELRALTGEMTARFKSIIASAGTSN